MAGALLGRGFPERLRTIVFQSLGLCVMLIGLSMALEFTNLIRLVFSMLLGAVCGEALNLERMLERTGVALKKRFGGREDSRFVDGFVTASLIYCVGSMAVLGSLDDGLRGDHTLLFTKSILDGVASIPLAATYGIGVAFSVLPVLLYQGAITLAASQAQGFFTPEMLAQMTAAGGLLILGIGINLLGLMRIRVTNMLPALVFAVLFSLWGGP